MKKALFFLILISIVVSILLVSCKKETSCKDCNDKPPVAIAGTDVVSLPADSIQLDGSSSYDPDGKIVIWRWKKILGPASFNIVTPNDPVTIVRNLINGFYQFELEVIDNKGHSARDTIQVITDALATNHPPVAHAGPDQRTTLPINTVTLDGSASSDPDNNIKSYTWTKISGPASFSIANASAVQTRVTNLVEGVYQFELKVTDTEGLFSRDTIQVTVLMNRSIVCSNCKIVFVSARDGNEEIYSCNADGSQINRLTYNSGFDGDPVWSPDHSRIAFISDRTGKRELYIMNADGSNVVRKTFSETYIESPAWSPDGTKIAYARISNGSMNIWAIDVTTGTASRLFEAPGWDSHPAWSPDGKKLAITSDWAAYDFVYDVYTINADGSGFTSVTNRNNFDGIDYLHPAWSPTGAKISLAIHKSTGIDQYDVQIAVINPDGTGLKALITGAAPHTKTCWSDDGTRIAYTSLSGSGRDVSWVSADGTASGTIVTNGWNANW